MGAVAVALLAMGAVSLVAPAPAGAAPDPSAALREPYYFDRTPAVGWVDGDGTAHQAVIREAYQRDEAWVHGTDVQLDAPDPAGDGNQEWLVAADADGTLTVAVRGDETPVLWVSRFGTDDVQIGETVVVDADEHPYRPQTDGSFLTALGGVGTVRWRGSDGTSRAVLGATPATVRGATVDAQGRLLVAHGDGVLRRWTTAGDVDLALDAGCTAAADPVGGFAVAADSVGGYATACGAAEGPLALEVTRYDQSGTEQWSNTSESDGWGISQPMSGTIDDAGRVWFEGRACQAPEPASARCAYGTQVLRAHGPEGPSVDPTEVRTIGGWYVAPSAEPRRWGDGVVAAASQPPDVNYKGFWVDGFTYSFRMPESPYAPTCKPPTTSVVGAGAGSATIRFGEGCRPVRLPTAESDATHYRVEALGPDLAVAASLDVPLGEDGTGEQTVTIDGLEGGVRYRFQVRSVNATGDGPIGPRTPGMTPPFATLPEFVDQQYQDLVGRAPTPQEATNVKAELDFGSATPAQVVDRLFASPWSGPRVDPLTRLYRAYFGRTPDTSGLRYWVERRRQGVTLERISSTFAGSTEFRRKYGSLSDRAFVELVYENVLGRAGDPGGISYWTKQLSTGRRNRGQVMVGFSESAEHVRATLPTVVVVGTVFGLLQRAPSPTELATWVPQLAGSTPRTDLIGAILESEEYAQRIT